MNLILFVDNRRPSLNKADASQKIKLSSLVNDDLVGKIVRQTSQVLSQEPGQATDQKMALPSSLPVVKKVVVPEAKISSPPKVVKKNIAKKPTPAPVKPNRVAPINIKRQFVPDSVYQLLTKAYRAYQVGDDRVALSFYSKVLNLENNNRDAMLGLAAISVRNNQFDKARDTYIALLENDPKDNVALSGLLNIQSNVEPVKSETKIKLLLSSEPGSPHLLFTLGSLYASQSRWAEAQKEFFKAFSSDNQNADFAYNLAVSLDQLEQRTAALKYYRATLELVKQQPISFNVNDVMKRINVLQEVSGG